MALRFLLVSLVAGLGVNLPSGDEFSSWVGSGRAWVQARVDDIRGTGADAEAWRSDAEFVAIVDDMANTFAADLATLDRPKSDALLAAALLEVAEDELVEAEVVTVVEVREPAATAEVFAIDIDNSEEAASTGTSRLASAVELTRQAADAWMNVLRGDGSASLGR